MAMKDFNEYKIKTLKQKIEDTQTRVEEIQAELMALPGYDKYYEMFKNGILLIKFVKCGNPQCKCNANPINRHGPYNYFQYVEGGKLHQKYLKKNTETDKIVDIIRKNGELKKAKAEHNKAIRELREFKKAVKKDEISNDNNN